MRWRYTIGLLALLGLAAALVILAAATRGPSYLGRGLGAWLRELRHPSPLVQHRAQEAVRHIGSKAVPVLRRQLHAVDPPLITNIVSLLQRQTWVPIPFVPARERRIQAALACAILGPVAEPAIPDLLESSQGDSFCLNLSESALGEMGEAGVGRLSLALTNTDFRLRGIAAGALVHVGLQARAAVPALTNCLKDDYSWVRENAARALGRIGVASPGVMRALAEAGGDENSGVSISARIALIELAKSAAPVLSTMLTNANPTVRSNAWQALKATSP